jgi:hypothetical protein
MAMTEKQLRQIIKEEATALLGRNRAGGRRGRRGLREGRLMGGDMGGHGDGDDLVHVESEDNPELDGMLTEWQELTYRLIELAGDETFVHDDDDSEDGSSMREIMLNVINAF